MNDTLTSAYERLTTALEPPVDHRDLVTARIAQRRRRRRTVQGLASASVAAAVVASVTVASTYGGGQAPAAPAAPDGVPVASSGSAEVTGGRASCKAEAPPPGTSAVGDDDLGLRDLLEQLGRVEGLGVGKVRFLDDGDVTTAYLIGDDGTTLAQLRAVGGRVRDLVRCH